MGLLKLIADYWYVMRKHIQHPASASGRRLMHLHWERCHVVGGLAAQGPPIQHFLYFFGFASCVAWWCHRTSQFMDNSWLYQYFPILLVLCLLSSRRSFCCNSDIVVVVYWLDDDGWNPHRSRSHLPVANEMTVLFVRWLICRRRSLFRHADSEWPPQWLIHCHDESILSAHYQPWIIGHYKRLNRIANHDNQVIIRVFNGL